MNSVLEYSVEASNKLEQKLNSISHIPPLGFRNLLANSVFLNFLQYFSDVSERETVGQNLSPMFFDQIISLDPFYRDYYLFLSSSTTLYAAQPQRTVDLMSKGLERINPSLLSDSFYIWRYKGVDELLFLGDSQAAKKSFRKSAEWAAFSNLPESDLVGAASQQTAAFLERDPDSRYAQIAAWNSVLSNAMNESIRDKAIERIRVLSEEVDPEDAHMTLSPENPNSSSSMDTAEK
ncbi:MAG: hypothetical protein WA949_23720 [Phormidesmis sp.]